MPMKSRLWSLPSQSKINFVFASLEYYKNSVAKKPPEQSSVKDVKPVVHEEYFRNIIDIEDW